MRPDAKLCLVAAVAGLAGLAIGAGWNNERSPHADALALVLKDQAKAIVEAENPRPIRPEHPSELDWWFDTAERSWTVRRPIEPGIVNSTHWFAVDYRVGGKVVAHWSVDTTKGTAELVKPKVPEAPKSARPAK